MKTLQELIKDLTGCTVEQKKLNAYLEHEALDLRGADLWGTDLENDNLEGADLNDANLQRVRIKKSQLDQLIIEEDK